MEASAFSCCQQVTTTAALARTGRRGAAATSATALALLLVVFCCRLVVLFCSLAVAVLGSVALGPEGALLMIVGCVTALIPETMIKTLDWLGSKVTWSFYKYKSKFQTQKKSQVKILAVFLFSIYSVCKEPALEFQ